MGSKKRTIGILIVVIVVLLGFAGSLLVYRNNLSSENKKNNSNNNTAQSLSSAPSGKIIENFYDKPITDEKIALDSIEVNRNKLGYSDENFTFKFITENGYLGASYRFKILYKNIPIYGASIIVSAYKNGTPDLLVSSEIEIEKLNKINTKNKITQDEASNIIKNKIDEEIDRKPELIIYETNNEYYLSYYFDASYQTCIINAENGEVITCHSNLIFGSAEYSGQNGDIHQVFYNDYKNEKYDVKNALWDNEKNIFIINNRSDYNYDSYNNNLFKLEDIQSDKNKSAVDGMANTYRAVEYFDKHFDKKFDITYVCVNVDNCKDADGEVVKDNACGRYINKQNKEISCLIFCVSSNAKNPQDSAYLDTVSHEYTHTITASVFGTNYGREFKYHERNALMEAYSDIFGELIEAKYTGKADWYHNKVRSLIKHEDTDNKRDYTYKYSQKYQTTDIEKIEDNDYGGAHYNSTIISHVAYLMSKDNNSSKYEKRYLLNYDELAQLWYGALNYLNDTSTFSDCRIAVSRSAMKLIKEGTLFETSLSIIEQAFDEVEVKTNYSITNSGSQAMEIIKDKNTIVVPIEDETQSTEPVEIKELNYTWHLEPTIEAEDIILSDIEKYAIFVPTANPFDEYSIVKQNGKYRFIKYDGTYISDKQYDKWYFSNPTAITCSSENDNYDCITILGGKKGNEISYKPHDAGWGKQGFYIDNKTKDVYGTEYGSSSIYNDEYNVVVQSADISITNNTLELNNIGKYGIANNNGLVVDCVYNDACMNIGDDIIALEKDGKWGYFNKDGTQIIDFICEPFESKILDVMWLHHHEDENISHPFLSSSGYIPVKINGKCGYYDTKGNEVIPCGTFEEVRPVHNGLAWVKKDGKWGVIELSIPKKEATNDLIVQTEKLTNNDIKSEWAHVTSLELEYPIFKTNNTELQNFLNVNVTNKILGFMETETDYNVFITGGFEYDMSINGYLSINGFFSNHPEGGNGYIGSFYYTFFVDLNNKKILTLKDLFSESEDVVYNEICQKANKYVKTGILLSKDSLNNYDYTNANFILTKDKLTLCFSPYEISTGAVGGVKIEIPVSDLNLSCTVSGIKTSGFKGEKDEPSEEKKESSSVSDYDIFKAVNKYLEENRSNLGIWLSDGNPYCPYEHMASNSTNWSCPINTDWDSYSSNEMAGAYPHFAYVDKSALKCTLTANYETVVEFDLNDYIQ